MATMIVRVTVLVANTTERSGLLAEHGIAYWLEFGGQHVLFDTGQSRIVVQNAEQLQIPVRHPDAIVLSHGHYDHTGGLAHVFDHSNGCRVFGHSDALQKKYLRDGNGKIRSVGMPQQSLAVVKRHAERWVATSQPTRIVDRLFATGEIPRRTDYEDTGGAFFLDRDCQKPDRLLDDQALFFDTNQGIVVLLGCAHAGVINTLQYIRNLNGDRSIHAVLGGMHLGQASADRLRTTIRELGQFDMQMLAPGHCTGAASTAALWHAYPDLCVSCHAGSQFEFEIG
jgi:7,8-dihydropterin-6-yl-methyl-4-(beta-D-ribofuranosyl)aminobenzene 5'-phosphate synthase